ncbi:MAG: phage terminase large subunit family protein, partial [Rickettsiales bacterium]|nr:phage terminase large subunit family protein [Rickettsiales bacterium]
MTLNTIALSILKKAASLAAPPPNLKISQWADQFRQLSSEASAEPGRWITDRAPYQRDIMDALGDAKVEAVVIMS